MREACRHLHNIKASCSASEFKFPTLFENNCNKYSTNYRLKSNNNIMDRILKNCNIFFFAVNNQNTAVFQYLLDNRIRFSDEYNNFINSYFESVAFNKWV